MDLKLRGKVVLVTGGSRGIGFEIARQFASEGARVAICGRNGDSLGAAEAAIRADGGDCTAIQADLFQAEAADLLVQRTVAALAGVDVLVNNASTNVDCVPARLEDATDSQLMERISGKLMGAIRCSRAVIPHMRRVGGGRIICIGGTSARAVPRSGSRSELPQGLGNSALASFVSHLAEDIARDRILVNVVHPYQTKTDRTAGRIAKLAAERGVSAEAAAALLDAGVPIGRMVEPADIAPLILFLASPLAGAITGQAIAIDGGAVPTVNY